MALLQEWQKIAYNEQADRAKLQKFWQDYFLVEKGIYEKLLDHPDEEVSGTVKELADKYQVSLMAVSYTHLDVYKRQPILSVVMKRYV